MARTTAPKRKGAAKRAGKPAKTAKAATTRAKAKAARKPAKATRAAKPAKARKAAKASPAKARSKAGAKAKTRAAAPVAKKNVAAKKKVVAKKKAGIRKPVAAQKKAAPKKVVAAKKAVAKAAPRKQTPAKPAVAFKPAAKRPALDRDRRVVRDAEVLPSAPSSLVPNRHASAASSGADEMRVRLAQHTGGQELAAGDPDVDWQGAETVGDEAPGGDNPTPDQDVVEDIGRALGVQYDDDEELQGGDEIAARDHDRWELDPASSEDFDDRE